MTRPEKRLLRYCAHCGEKTTQQSLDECQACGGPLVEQTSLGEHS